MINATILKIANGWCSKSLSFEALYINVKTLIENATITPKKVQFFLGYSSSNSRINFAKIPNP